MDLTDPSLPWSLRADETLGSVLARVHNVPCNTGLGVLDQLDSGAGPQPGDIIEICGETGSGKTLALMLSICNTLVATEPVSSIGSVLLSSSSSSSSSYGTSSLLHGSNHAAPSTPTIARLSPRYGLQRVVLFDLEFRIQIPILFQLLLSVLAIYKNSKHVSSSPSSSSSSSSLPAAATTTISPSPSLNAAIPAITKEQLISEARSCLSRLEVYRPRTSRELALILEQLASSQQLAQQGMMRKTHYPRNHKQGIGIDGDGLIGGGGGGGGGGRISLLCFDGFGSSWVWQDRVGQVGLDGIGVVGEGTTPLPAATTTTSTTTSSSNSNGAAGGARNGDGTGSSSSHNTAATASVTVTLAPSVFGGIIAGQSATSSTSPISTMGIPERIAAAISRLSGNISSSAYSSGGVSAGMMMRSSSGNSSSKHNTCRVLWTRPLLFRQVPSIFSVTSNLASLESTRTAATSDAMRVFRLLNPSITTTGSSSSSSSSTSNGDHRRQATLSVRGDTGATQSVLISPEELSSCYGDYLPKSLYQLVKYTVLMTRSNTSSSSISSNGGEDTLTAPKHLTNLLDISAIAAEVSQLGSSMPSTNTSGSHTRSSNDNGNRNSSSAGKPNSEYSIGLQSTTFIARMRSTASSSSPMHGYHHSNNIHASGSGANVVLESHLSLVCAE